MSGLGKRLISPISDIKLNLIAHDGVNVIQYQNERDYIIKSIVKEFRHNTENKSEIEQQLQHLIKETGYQLDTMKGINLITASHKMCFALLAEQALRLAPLKSSANVSISIFNKCCGEG